MKIYLDVCCLCRPFDNQLVPRIRYESEAVIAILNRCSVDWTLIWSYAIIYEVSKIIDGQKNQYLSNLRDRAEICIMVDGAIKNRAELFMGCGIKALDALHLSCAERAGVDFFITTDDKLKNIMSRYRDISTVKVVNPAQWYQEVVDDESENAA
ncbi:hypothetical protein [Methanocalculus sp.]|uniref:hypothetical protein n=1 Tax=Methanocalculus sp. TaxID=2004547 RepID=UPI0018402FEB|nr:hypothetical protein [Methanocalculus sp.]HIJ07463.1 type II toxin-antitoxin system VapC family toxin [Methanocalculus sp.]